MVESIKELRKICQKKSYLYDKKGEENTSKPVEEYFYDQFLRLVSIYITKLFLYTSITSNQVTIISMVVGIFAGIAFSFSHPFYWIGGFLLLQLFHFLDAVDGEIARYRKEASPIGKYFDLLAHGVVIAAFYIGITFGIYKVVNNQIIFLFGFIALTSFLLASLSNAIKSSLLYQYILLEKKTELLEKIKTTSKKVYPYSLKYAVRRMLGFDGFAFIVLIFTLLDLIFHPGILTISTYKIIINWRFLFLFLSAIMGPFVFVRRMQTTAKLKNKI
ncbi:MAG: CDP-alcohol phosphatidyltransferase family protein [Nanoarchaeota archaeon]|nr:CDP-alcohol phosphatidyltransferase family protein [Nanoarchaeota archaeon]